MLARVVCTPRDDLFALELPERMPRGRWALPAAEPSAADLSEPLQLPLILEVRRVEPASAAPGTRLRIHLRLDGRVTESKQLAVSVGGALRPTFQLVDCAVPDPEDDSYQAILVVPAPVFHSRGPWSVQVHAHGASSAPSTAAQVCIQVQPLRKTAALSVSASAERLTPARR